MAAPIVTDYPSTVSDLRIIAVKPDGTPCFLLATAEGKLDIGLSFDGTVNVGTVSMSQATPGTSNGVVVNSSALPTDAATQTTLASLLAKVIAAPATEAKQDNEITKLTSIDDKVATQTTLAAILAKLIAGPATEATLAALNAKVTAMNSGATVIASGSVTSTPVAPTRGNSSVYEASRVVKAAAGRLFNLSGYNSGPAQFIQIHDAVSLPAESAVPVAVFAIPSLASFSFDFGGVGLPCATGIVVCNSSTAPTKTIGSANIWITAVYI